MIEQSYLYIVLVGFTSLGVVYYFHKIFNNLLKLLSKLLQLQPSQYQNIKEYIEELEVNLLELDIQNIYYDISYSHKRLLKEAHSKKTLISKDIDDALIKGSVTLEVQNNRGEKKIVNQLILYVITLQITNAIHANINTINASFERVSKLQTYMMHDLKNILQFFQAMQYNVEHITTKEEESQFIDFLQNSTQPINRKVNKILALLKVKSTLEEDSFETFISVRELFLEYIEYFKLDATIEGDAKLYLNEENFRTIVDNLLGNIYDKMHYNLYIKVVIKITQESEFCDIIITDSGDSFENIEEVFEPFYTTKPQGIGIGMYQVSTLVELMGGKIECSNVKNKPTVKIRFSTIRG